MIKNKYIPISINIILIINLLYSIGFELVEPVENLLAFRKFDLFGLSSLVFSLSLIFCLCV